MTASVAAAPRLRPAVHGDRWSSSWFFLHRAGQPIDLDDWTIRAEVRAGAADDPLFTWTRDTGGIAFGVATVRIPSTQAQLQLSGLQLRLRPRDWGDQPRRWSGSLELELSHGPADDPIDRHTERRRFVIVPDLIR